MYRYVSGTPFPYKLDSFKNAMTFLETTSAHYNANDERSFQDFLFDDNIVPVVHNSLFWRNTKHSVGDEYNVPGTNRFY